MRNLRILIPAVLVAGAALYFGYFYLWLEDDERIIHSKVNRLVEVAGKDGNETVFVGVSRAREIADHFSSDFSLDLGRPFPGGVSGRDELTAAIVQVRANAQELSLRATDRQLEIAEDGESAVMELTGRGSLSHSGGEAREARRFRVEWIREDGDWKIETVELLDIIN